MYKYEYKLVSLFMIKSLSVQALLDFISILATQQFLLIDSLDMIIDYTPAPFGSIG